MDICYDFYYRLICKDESEYPKLKICYSLNRTCQMVTIDETDYLIYDQYLGQSINHLMLLYYSKKTSETDILRYFHKCSAEYYYVSGQVFLATINAVFYEVLQKDFDIHAHLDSINIMCKAGDVMMQEMFVMLHELYHWKLARCDRKEALIEEKRKELLSKNPFAMYPHVIYPVYEFFTPEQREQERDQWLNEDSNIEEILCDEYALKRLIGIFAFVPDTTVAEASMLAMDCFVFLNIVQDDARYMSEEEYEVRKEQVLVGMDPENPYESRERSIADPSLRAFYFIYVTCMDVLNVKGDPEVYLYQVTKMHGKFEDKIINTAYRKYLLKIRPDVDKKIDEIMMSEDVEKYYEYIPKWGT